MASNSQKIAEAASTDSPTATPVGKQSATTTTEVVGDPKSERIKPTRYPRWTRQETLLLIEAKKMVENRDQLCNLTPSSILLNHTDPKWNIVSSCVQQQGVKRGPIQCRKRWGNLLTDFRKVKKYESDMKDDGESFWMMRSDKRKENKLPGFFDEVVYKVIDGDDLSGAAVPLALMKMASKPESSAEHAEKVKLLGQSKDDEDGDEDEEDETIADSEKMYWSTEKNTFEANSERKMGFSAIKASTSKETLLRGSVNVTPTLALALAPPGFQREPESEEGYKRRRLSPENDDTTNFSNDVIKVLRRNTNIMKTYLEAQNMNHQLAMEQQKEQSDKLVAALGKITDAITKIADKL
ncbi:hypothetical protein TanjilG_06480 [Lupinus angustifolius]|uniref:Myb-like domain-containing protein n=2 Tax=Lupinus angustifolius TaxID=3871 RepID=A0A1J7HYJ2_LUPAN|nr:hypothetical protein TanjilG_06480 [Lupinus angustifolius]